MGARAIDGSGQGHTCAVAGTGGSADGGADLWNVGHGYSALKWLTVGLRRM